MWVDYALALARKFLNFQKERIMAMKRKSKFHVRIVLKYVVKIILDLILILLKYDLFNN